MKDLCRFLLQERNWRDGGQVSRYIRDYRNVSRAHLAFHAKWSDLGTMAGIAAFDRKEIEKVSELLAAITGRTPSVTRTSRRH